MEIYIQVVVGFVVWCAISITLILIHEFKRRRK